MRRSLLTLVLLSTVLAVLTPLTLFLLSAVTQIPKVPPVILAVGYLFIARQPTKRRSRSGCLPHCHNAQY